MRKEATESSPREMVPHVLTALLQGLEEKYNDVSDDGQCGPSLFEQYSVSSDCSAFLQCVANPGCTWFR